MCARSLWSHQRAQDFQRFQWRHCREGFEFCQRFAGLLHFTHHQSWPVVRMSFVTLVSVHPFKGNGRPIGFFPANLLVHCFPGVVAFLPISSHRSWPLAPSLGRARSQWLSRSILLQAHCLGRRTLRSARCQCHRDRALQQVPTVRRVLLHFEALDGFREESRRQASEGRLEHAWLSHWSTAHVYAFRCTSSPRSLLVPSNLWATSSAFLRTRCPHCLPRSYASGTWETRPSKFLRARWASLSRLLPNLSLVSDVREERTDRSDVAPGKHPWPPSNASFLLPEFLHSALVFSCSCSSSAKDWRARKEGTQSTTPVSPCAVAPSASFGLPSSKDPSVLLVHFCTKSSRLRIQAWVQTDWLGSWIVWDYRSPPHPLLSHSSTWVTVRSPAPPLLGRLPWCVTAKCSPRLW